MSNLRPDSSEGAAASNQAQALAAADLLEQIAELEELNELLPGARQAALKLIEDAIAAREKLQRSEARFSALVNHSTAGICRADVNGELTFVNQRLCEMLGYGQSELIGKSIWQILYDAEPEANGRFLEKTIAELPFQTENQLVRTDGTPLWASCSLSSITNSDGQPAAITAVVVDISERKKAEQIIELNLRDTQVLQALSAHLVSEENIQTAYEKILEAEMTLTSADAGTVQTLDEKANELQLLAMKGLPDEFKSRFERVGAGSNTSCALALSRKERSYVDFDVPAEEDEDGSLRMHADAGFLTAQSTPLVTRSGKVIGMVSTHWRMSGHRLDERESGFLDLLARQAADIIEQRRAAQAIVEVNERLRVATEAAELGTWEWDVETDRVIWNDQHFKMLGLEPRPGPVDVDEFFRRVHPDDLQEIQKNISRSMELGSTYDAVFRIVGEDGHVRWMSGYGRQLTRGEGRRRCMSGVILDITYRMEMEGELRESNDRMRLLIESATDYAIFTTDNEGIINSWNSGSERIFGYPEDEIMGRSAAILFTDEDRESGLHVREMEVARSTGRSLDERWHRRKDGSTFFASGVVQPLANGDEGFVKIARDMTERLLAERERRDKELLQTLVDAQESERRRIARDLHDELGQLLTAMRLKLENITNARPEQLAARVEEVKGIAKRIDDGVDFLAWELRPAPLEDLGLVAAIEKYAEEWSSYAEVSSSVAGSNVHGHLVGPNTETAIYRIVQESLNNIHKHAKAKNVEVTLRRRDKSLVLIIEDDGIGFDPDDREVRSRGIGLVGMKERAEMIGGSLEIESTPGNGTTLYIKVPIS